ncbi:MAG: class I SAM-dependent methyltransferase [Deltaproteobacteria bacterium]|nr:class I SAM-dependent methyltransferase [Deltaproteobacteria bacterium]
MDSFDEAYRGEPPWDIGGAQPVVRELEKWGRIGPTVLDVGCGTGENVLYLAERGYEAWGIDLAPRAIHKARSKAVERKLDAVFLEGDALELARLGRRFDTVLDCGMFHTLEDVERRRFAESLDAAVRPGGSYYLLCFSEEEPGMAGPRRVTQQEIFGVFDRPGWLVREIVPTRFESRMHEGGAHAWFATIEREGRVGRSLSFERVCAPDAPRFVRT